MNYLIWKGKDSRDIKGLIICELPPITKPPMRVAETTIDGVDGSMLEELGYASYDKGIAIGLTRDANINEVIEYFTGSGEVVFSNEGDKCYKAIIANQIDYARLVRFRTATVVFRVQPFKYLYQEAVSVVDNADNTLNSAVVINIGNYTAKPVMEIEGSGEVVLSVNGSTLFRYTFPEGENTVVIDSEKQDAYVGVNLKNRNMIGEFPVLDKGTNTISWDGSITKMIITSKSRWL